MSYRFDFGKESSLNQLPDEIIEKIMKHMPYRDRIRFRMTNQSAYDAPVSYTQEELKDISLDKRAYELDMMNAFAEELLSQPPEPSQEEEAYLHWVPFRFQKYVRTDYTSANILYTLARLFTELKLYPNHFWSRVLQGKEVVEYTRHYEKYLNDLEEWWNSSSPSPFARTVENLEYLIWYFNSSR